MNWIGPGIWRRPYLPHGNLVLSSFVPVEFFQSLAEMFHLGKPMLFKDPGHEVDRGEVGTGVLLEMFETVLDLLDQVLGKKHLRVARLLRIGLR